MRKLCFISLVFLLCVGSAVAGESDRGSIVSRADQFLTISLRTSQGDEDCLACNLTHPNLAVCDPTTSDIQWHADYLNGDFAQTSWSGMPYAFGNGYNPDDDVQGSIDACKSIGNHLCHYSGNDCGYPGCDWAVGTECTALVCWAGGVSRRGSCHMGEVGGTIEWDDAKQASFLSWCSHHAVLIESRSGQILTILEATGNWPVSRRIDKALSDYSSYTPHDFNDVIAAEGSDGVLLATQRGDSVKLLWKVDSASNVRWYEFQYWDESAEIWVTFDDQDFVGVGEYMSNYSGPGAASLVYRVRENDTGGKRHSRCETVAFEASN